MRAVIGFFLFAGLGGAFASLTSCGVACEEDGTCPPKNNGDGGNRDSDTQCDTTKTPIEASCLVSEKYAVFVAPAPQDGGTGSGTKTDPATSIGHGVELAKASGKFVIVCNGTYDESVKLTGGAKIYGGFACPDAASPWTYEAGTKPNVAPSARGPALEIQSVADHVLISDVQFVSQPGANAGDSSIAAIVVASPRVSLERVRLTASTGQNGANAVADSFTFPDLEALRGNEGTTNSGGATKECTCPGGTNSKGGQGGAPTADTAAASGASGSPDYPGAGGEGGDALQTCGSGATGQDGAPGADAGSANGANTLGSLSSGIWLPSTGANGPNGSAGQGGGGGAGKTKIPGGGGGSGGCGGCGGKGGPGGGGGGASIALIAMSSGISLEGCALVTANAGSGGKGVAGQAGQVNGGLPGNGSSPGCDGGNGGPGGKGGAGGGGAGGISVGVVYKGQKPTSDAATAITTGTAGTKGLGGVPGTNDGIDGVAQPDLEVP